MLAPDTNIDITIAKLGGTVHISNTNAVPVLLSLSKHGILDFHDTPHNTVDHHLIIKAHVPFSLCVDADQRTYHLYPEEELLLMI